MKFRCFLCEQYRWYHFAHHAVIMHANKLETSNACHGFSQHKPRHQYQEMPLHTTAIRSSENYAEDDKMLVGRAIVKIAKRKSPHLQRRRSQFSRIFSSLPIGFMTHFKVLSAPTKHDLWRDFINDSLSHTWPRTVDIMLILSPLRIPSPPQTVHLQTNNPIINKQCCHWNLTRPDFKALPRVFL